MNKVKVSEVHDDEILFENGYKLYSQHDTECCEEHYMYCGDLTTTDFEALEFDLEGVFFERIEGFGIALLPVNGHPVRIPCHAYNNGYYSDELVLVLEGNKIYKSFDITDCQEYM